MFRILLTATVCSIGIGAPARAAAEWPSPLASFFETHCYECHDADSEKGDLNLEILSRNLAEAESMRRWTLVYDRVDRGEMPPKKSEQPPEAERDQSLAALAGLLTGAHDAAREVVLRRLNRVEYEYTVRDLFGIDVYVKELLPEDTSSHGFDNIGESLFVSAEQMQVYLEVADVVLDTVFGPPEEPARIKTTLNLRDIIEEEGRVKLVRKIEDGVVLFNSGYNPSVLRTFHAPGPGIYRVRIQTRAVQTDRPVTMAVYGGVYGRRDKHIVGFYDIPPGEMTTIEFTDRLWERDDKFEMMPVDTVHRQTDPDNYDGPGLFLGDVELEGPLEEWPPPSRSKLFGGVDPQKGTLRDAERILRRVLPGAYRRPVAPAEIEPALALVREALDEGLSFEKALRVGLKGVLCSPEFLFLEEASDGAAVSDHALASRLSYFLWNSMPDAPLLAAAGEGRLGDAAVLQGEAERMLRDPKADRFTESFTGQWLMLRDIDFTLPDRKLYPDYDELLRESMLKESHLFFREILENDLSLLNFIDSEFVTINERLAKHYGIPGVSGQGFRKVTLSPESVRGGVLTQASVLKVTANGTTTSPVIRGAWVLDNILGRPSPPPPPNVPAIEPDIRGATTIREQLDKHRDIESCARCHKEIDPPGFALENFDVIGGWRDFYRTLGGGERLERDPRYPNRFTQYRRGPDVISSGESPDGTAFQGIKDYKRLLLEDKDQVARCLVRKLLTYALGRPLGFSDRADVASIVTGLREKNYGFRSLVHGIVQSDAFREP